MNSINCQLVTLLLSTIPWVINKSTNDSIRLWLLWKSGFWCQCWIFVLTLGGLLPTALFWFSLARWSTYSAGSIFIKSTNLPPKFISILAPLISRVSFGMPSSKVCCKWSQFPWEEMESSLLMACFSPQAVSEQGFGAGDQDKGKFLSEWHLCSWSWGLR